MKSANDSMYDVCAFHTTIALLESAVRIFEQLSVDGASEYQRFAETQAAACKRKQLRVVSKYHRAQDRLMRIAECAAAKGDGHANN